MDRQTNDLWVADDIYDSFVEAVEDELSMGCGAWDMVDPKEIIAAVLNTYRQLG